MGANAVNNTYTRYFKALRGFMVSKPNPNAPNEQVEPFEFKTGTYEYAVFGSLEGQITMIEIKDGDYGKELRIFMSDGPDNFCFTTKYDSGEAMDFYKKMKVINYQEDVQLAHWKPKDKKYYRLLVMQKNAAGEWDKLGYSFTQDEVPDWKEVELNGETKWDKGPALKFFMKELAGVVKQIALYGHTAKKAAAAKVVVVDEENSDLPF